jgi:hypothetical protein
LGQFIKDYPWLFGIIMILGGPIIAFYGRRFFPWVIASIVFISTLLITLVICQLIGLFSGTVGIAVSLVVAVTLSVVTSRLAMKTVWISVSLLGLIGGFIMGCLIYTVYIAAIGSGNVYLMLLVAITCSIAGGYLSLKFQSKFVLLFTSFIGAYVFVKGFCYFIGGFPSIITIMFALFSTKTVDGLTAAFWLYFAVMICVFSGGFVY